MESAPASTPQPAGIQPTVPITLLTLNDCPALTASQRAVLKTRVERTADLKDITDLEQRIFEFVHVNSALDTRPVRAVELNRRFGRTAKRLNTSIMDVLSVLYDRGLLTRLENKRITAVFSTSIYNEGLGDWKVLECAEAEYPTFLLNNA